MMEDGGIGLMGCFLWLKWAHQSGHGVGRAARHSARLRYPHECMMITRNEVVDEIGMWLK